MSRRSVFAAIALLALGGPALAQIPVSNSNSFELNNGAEAFLTFVATNVPTPGVQVAGSGIVNGNPAVDVMFWTILPKELMHSSNGTNPGTMELTSIEVSLIHSFFGSGGGGTPSMLWDMTLTPVTYTNPVSGAANDNRRYPDLAVAPIATLLGGPTGLPAPAGCAAPQYWTYALAIEFGTAVPGTGIVLPADGNTDVAWCFWEPGGMSTLPADPSACEVGGNLSMMTLASGNFFGPVGGERVPPGVTTGAAAPAPTGVNRNPFHGARNMATATLFNSRPNDQGWEVWAGFRDPILQFEYFYTAGTSTVSGAMAAPERGSGAMYMDALGAVTVNPGFRTCASGHLGELVIHVLTSDLVNYPTLGQPGIAVTPTSNLLLSPADPNFFLVTPLFDVFLGSNMVDYYFAEKHTATSPMTFGLNGPIAGPGLQFAVQAFIVNIAAGPPFGVVSTNVAHGQIW
jgi:hypothetical protein